MVPDYTELSSGVILPLKIRILTLQRNQNHIQNVTVFSF